MTSYRHITLIACPAAAMKAFPVVVAVTTAQALLFDSTQAFSVRQAVDIGIVLYNDRTDQCLSKAQMWDACTKVEVATVIHKQERIGQSLPGLLRDSALIS